MFNIILCTPTQKYTPLNYPTGFKNPTGVYSQESVYKITSYLNPYHTTVCICAKKVCTAYYGSDDGGNLKANGRQIKQNTTETSGINSKAQDYIQHAAANQCLMLMKRSILYKLKV